MELKLVNNALALTADDSFNRTSVELKLSVVRGIGVNLSGFNRTSVELKLGREAPRAPTRTTLIEPAWN